MFVLLKINSLVYFHNNTYICRLKFIYTTKLKKNETVNRNNSYQPHIYFLC